MIGLVAFGRQAFEETRLAKVKVEAFGAVIPIAENYNNYILYNYKIALNDIG